MVFRVNYNKTGDVVSYQEGGDDSDNQCPDGCSTLCFAEFVQGFNDFTQMKMKVDVAKKQLVYINPQVIPEPINQ